MSLLTGLKRARSTCNSCSFVFPKILWALFRKDFGGSSTPAPVLPLDFCRTFPSLHIEGVFSTPVKGTPVANPILNRMRADIDAAGGIEYIATLVADGLTMKRIGQRFGVSRALIYRYVNESPERKERFDQAREHSADSLVEDSMDDLEAPLPPGAGSAEVSLRTSRANFKKWVASIRSEKYRDNATGAVTLQVNLGADHLAALMSRGRPPVLQGTEVAPATPAPKQQLGLPIPTNSVIEELI